MIRERAASNQDGQNPEEHRKRGSIHIQIVVRDELRDSIDDVRTDELWSMSYILLQPAKY